MNQKTNKLICIFLLLSLCLSAQMGDYAYKREIKNSTEQWHQISLPNTIYEKTKNTLGDIRIYGITATDTIEAPYVLNIKSSKSKINSVDFELLNQTFTNDQYLYTFKLPSKTSINEIFLNFETANFDYKITLEGSQNLTDWSTIIQDYRIISIVNASADYRFTTLKFPEASFVYFKVSVNTTEDPVFSDAKIYENNSVPADYENYEPKSVKIEHDKKTKESIITIDLDKALPVSYLHIKVNNNFDYLRPTSISYVLDSVKTEKGWHYNYRNLATSVLSSLDHNEFTFFSEKAKKIKIIINNQDNPPIDIIGAEVKGFKHELVARFDKPAAYYLAYGNPNALEPVYDISTMANVVPETAKMATLGNELRIDGVIVEETKPLFEDKKWLWGIMVL
ncbi:MAG: DUF3999 domain-containing protein, partial [Cellulophaga sp.]|nr:DUF3999 domain-containing protein [Cellulophaga sp.]